MAPQPDEETAVPASGAANVTNPLERQESDLIVDKLKQLDHMQRQSLTDPEETKRNKRNEAINNAKEQLNQVQG